MIGASTWNPEPELLNTQQHKKSAIDRKLVAAKHNYRFCLRRRTNEMHMLACRGKYYSIVVKQGNTGPDLSGITT